MNHPLLKDNLVLLRYVLPSFILLVSSIHVSSADLVEVSAISNNIIMLRFDEGHIDYSGIDPTNGAYQGTFGNFQTVYWDLFDLAEGSKKENYTITVNGNAFQPTNVFVKAKGRDYNDPQANDGEPDQIMEYKIYLVLPQILNKGERYTIALGDLATNLDAYTFVFDEKNLRSETIHINQLGFTPESEKYVYLSQWMGTGKDVDLSDFADAKVEILDVESGQVVETYNGFTLQKAKNDKDNNPWGNFTQADVWDLNFSDFNKVGEYKIVVEGLGCSYPFEIRENIYREAYYLAMRGLYYQRSGIVRSVDEFDGTIYPRAHHSDQVDFYYDGKQKVYKHGDISNFSYDKKINQELFGWYNDAGDWDYYDRHWTISPAICFLYNLKPENFADGAINNRYKKNESDNQWVEEGKNGIPDLLDEAAWMLNFGKRFKDALIAENYGTGGVPGYVGEEAGAGGKPSWEDVRRMRVTAEMPGSTFKYASSAAMYAYSLSQFNQNGGNIPQAEINKWVKEAQDAFEWAETRYTTELRSRQLAAVSLYLYTGENKYQQIYEESHNGDNASKFNGSWMDLSTFAVSQAIYAILCADKPNLNQEFHEEIVNLIQRRANNNLGTELGFRLGGVEVGQFQKLNLWTVPRTFYQAAAYELSKDQKYLASVRNTVAYHLGANPENLATMTGLGDNPETDAFHIDSWYLYDFNDKVYENPILSGFTVYGRKAFDVGGIGNEARTVRTFIPEANVNEYTPWPVAEGRSYSRWSISGSEFTVNQNNIWSIFAFGYLSDDKPLAFTPNKAPTVELDFVENQSVNINEVILKSKVSSDTRKVKYYYDWHYIGESTDPSNNFSLEWDPKKVGFKEGDKVEITAVAYDNQGLIAFYDDQADKEISFVNGPVPTPSKGAQIKIKLMLEGFKAQGNQLLTDQLSKKNLLPINQPFNIAPFNYQGNENLGNDLDGIVDWIYVEVRDKDDVSKIVAQKACILINNGYLSEVDKSNVLKFDELETGDYFVAIYHKSHIAVMSNQVAAFKDEEPNTYDFTNLQTKAFGNEQLKEIENVFSLYCGDFDQNGIINNLDFNLWKQNAAAIDSYLSIDADGNGIVNNLDFNLWRANRSKIGSTEVKK